MKKKRKFEKNKEVWKKKSADVDNRIPDNYQHSRMKNLNCDMHAYIIEKKSQRGKSDGGR